MNRFWLNHLPSTDPAFTPLHHAAEFDATEFAELEKAHAQAIREAAWGRSLDSLDETARMLHEGARSRESELEAIGYALGVTAVRVALREHDEPPELALLDQLHGQVAELESGMAALSKGVA